MQTPNLVLVSHRLCPYVQRARIVLAEERIPHVIEFIDLANKPGWFTQDSPLGKVPMLYVDDRPLFESTVIAEYLDEISPGSLHPQDPLDKAHNRSWIEFASATLASVATFYRAADAEVLSTAAGVLRRHFEQLDRQLGTGPWFNGRRFSLVDAAFGPVFRYFEVIDRHVDFELFDGLGKLSAWRKTLADRPSVRDAVVSDYHERLRRFIVALDSELGRRFAFAGSGLETSGRKDTKRRASG